MARSGSLAPGLATLKVDEGWQSSVKFDRIRDMKRSYFISMGLAGLAMCLAGCRCLEKSPPDKATDLFNGKDLRGWGHVLADSAVSRDQVWSVRDGMIVCRGEPLGYLHTERAFISFRLEVEYRWAPGSKPGNSGIFSRVSGPVRALPRCAEVQLMHGNAGDVLTLQGMKLGAAQPRYFHVANHAVAGDIDGVRKFADRERAPGEWNQVKIEAVGPRYVVWLNGEKVNEAEGVEVLSGPIGLQSEGGEIHFRGIRVTPL